MTALVGGQMKVAGVAMVIQSIDRVAQTVQVVQLVDIPFELVDDDDHTLLPDFPDTSLMPDIFDEAYVLPVVDGGGNVGNNSQAVTFDLNVISPGEMNMIKQNAFQSAGHRADEYWVVWVLMAYQPNPDPNQPIDPRTTSGRADVDPDIEISLVGLGTPDGNSNNPLQQGIEQSGAFIFIETVREGVPQYGVGSLSDLEKGLVVHELGHSFGLPDREGSGIMSGNFGNPTHWFLTPEDIEIIRKRVKSPGNF
ncbi:hypothetical protein D6833_02100 [Candidatus Parcubacteria bacterium]|nr:MAG: hypothetical protein D6833_02100 [Candidatus Parcubacteria bacterium]